MQSEGLKRCVVITAQRTELRNWGGAVIVFEMRDSAKRSIEVSIRVVERYVPAI